MNKSTAIMLLSALALVIYVFTLRETNAKLIRENVNYEQQAATFKNYLQATGIIQLIREASIEKEVIIRNEVKTERDLANNATRKIDCSRAAYPGAERLRIALKQLRADASITD